MSAEIVLVQPNCGKYDLFIRDMPLGLLYVARLLDEQGYTVHIVDQRVLGEETYAHIDKLLARDPIWIGITAMSGEPVHHALKLCKFLKERTAIPLVWGGIHPTILADQTVADPFVDFVIRGKGERSVLHLSEALTGRRTLDDVPGLTWQSSDGAIQSNPEDDDSDWDAMPLVPYHLVDVEDYFRVGFDERIFSIMTSRNCPHKCTFCYNSAISTMGKFRWSPDSLDYTKSHIDQILAYEPNYLSFIDDDFFVDRDRARDVLRYVESVKPAHVKVGFRGVRVSDMRLLDDEDLDLLARINTQHINIGIESGSDRVLKIMKKGMKAEHAVELNQRFARYPQFTPLYNFFSGIPTETEDDIRLSTKLILRLVGDNPQCQISGFHQYVPYPGNALFEDAVLHGFAPPKSLEEWGDIHFEDNAANCPWIDAKRRRLLDMIYFVVYFVDSKYEMYFADTNWRLKVLHPFIKFYRHIARFRLRHHISSIPLEVYAKDAFYKLHYKPQ